MTAKNSFRFIVLFTVNITACIIAMEQPNPISSFDENLYTEYTAVRYIAQRIYDLANSRLWQDQVTIIPGGKFLPEWYQTKQGVVWKSVFLALPIGCWQFAEEIKVSDELLAPEGFWTHVHSYLHTHALHLSEANEITTQKTHCIDKAGQMSLLPAIARKNNEYLPAKECIMLWKAMTKRYDYQKALNEH